MFPVVHAFSIEVPLLVTVAETTKFKYTWTANDTRDRDNNTGVGIALFDARNPGVQSGRSSNVEAFENLRLGGNEGNASVEFAVKRTGTFYLQAYTFENSPTTVSVTISITYPTPTASTAQNAEGNNAQGGHHRRSLSPGATAGIVIGVLAFLLMLAAAFVFYRRRRYRKRVQQFHQERMVARSIPPSQMSFWVGDSKSFGGTSVGSPRSFGPGVGTGSPPPAPFFERDNFQFPTRDGRLTPLRGAGYSSS
ncbi:hypothetical protein PQX77_012150 [Marasmius sp. AFHP31]|nr:hypothetical protein PQX77_012150 [Marasmius sp. AFHP31]